MSIVPNLGAAAAASRIAVARGDARVAWFRYPLYGSGIRDVLLRGDRAACTVRTGISVTACAYRDGRDETRDVAFDFRRFWWLGLSDIRRLVIGPRHRRGRQR